MTLSLEIIVNREGSDLNLLKDLILGLLCFSLQLLITDNPFPTSFFVLVEDVFKVRASILFESYSVFPGFSHASVR